MVIVRSAKRLFSALGAVAVFGSATFAQWQAANPPLHLPTVWKEIPFWLATSPNQWITFTAIMGGLGAVATVQQLFFAPKALTAADIEQDGDRTRRALAEGGAETLAAIRDDKLAATIAAIRAGNLTPSQLDELKRTLSETVLADSVSTELTSNFIETVSNLATSNDPKLREIAVSEIAGDPAGAIEALLALGETDLRNAAVRFRDAGAMAAPFNVAQAIAAYTRAADLEPDDCWTWTALARLYQLAGNLAAARQAAQRGIQVASDLRARIALEICLGDIFLWEGDLPRAKDAYEAGLAIAQQLATHDASNTEWQHDLLVCYDKLGDIAFRQNNLPAARAAFQAGLGVNERLVALDSTNGNWQRSLSVNYSKLGDIAQIEGDLSAALTLYAAGLAITEQLAAADPSNNEWQRDLSISQNKMGDIAVKSGDLMAARASYISAFAITKQLVARDPSNSEWQRDLSLSQNKLGEIAVLVGNLPAALTAFAAGLAIREQLVALDPSNREWRRDLYISNFKLADVAERAGQADEARRRFLVARAIMAGLVGRFPNNPGFCNDLASTEQRLDKLKI